MNLLLELLLVLLVLLVLLELVMLMLVLVLVLVLVLRRQQMKWSNPLCGPAASQLFPSLAILGTQFPSRARGLPGCMACRKRQAPRFNYSNHDLTKQRWMNGRHRRHVPSGITYATCGFKKQPRHYM